MLRKLLLFIRKHYLKVDDRSQLEIAIANGLIIGKNVTVKGECIIDPGHCWLIEIGDNVTLAPRVHVLAHDASTKNCLGYTRIQKTKIGNNVFVGAGSIILPGVIIGDNCIIGAGSVISRSIPEGSVAAGNPASVIGSYEDFIHRRKEELRKGPVFDESYIIGIISEEKKKEMQQSLSSNKIGYII